MTTETDKQAIGGSGERKAAALLTMAVCAQTSHGTMTEDGGKVDLKLSFRSYLRPSSIITAHCQVKAGKSYRAKTSTKQLLKITVDSETLDALAEGSQPAFVAWVSPKPHGRIYWQSVQPGRRQKVTLSVPPNQFVTPSLRLDLSRVHAFRSRPSGYPVINLPVNTDDKLKRARTLYKTLKAEPVTSPVIGEIRFTRKGWRHVTRRSRDTAKTLRSFRLLPYLQLLLTSSPDRYLVVRNEPECIGTRTRETREIILWFHEAIKDNGIPCDVLMRLDERIEYPTKWSRDGLAPSDVEVITTVKSWWYKPSNPDLKK